MLRSIDEFKYWLKNTKPLAEKYLAEEKKNGEHTWVSEEAEEQLAWWNSNSGKYIAGRELTFTELAEYTLELISRLEKRKEHGFWPDNNATSRCIEEKIHEYDRHFMAEWTR